jgi:hypothetical protein
MILKIILFVVGIVTLLVLFFFQNALTKPIYNKMSNVWQDDVEGRQIANFIVWIMVIIGFSMAWIFK